MAAQNSGWKPDFIEHELGVHITLRHEAYLKDPGLGYSSVKDILINPVEWWEQSAWNPLRKPEGDKKAFRYGEAAHVHFLDGPKAYDKIYGVEPSPEFFPRHLAGGEQLRQACRDLGLSASGTLPELERRLKAADPEIQLFSDEVARWRASGRRPVPFDVDAQIRRLYRMSQLTAQDLNLGHGEIMTLEDAIKGGLFEVSVFWEDDSGVRHRARFDYLKPNASLDLKTITDWKKPDFRRSLLSEVILRGYVIQAAHYDVARQELRRAVDEGRVFGGNKKQRALLERIARADAWAWVWIFLKMNGAPQVKGIVLDKEGMQFSKAVRQREEGISKFVFHREFFGMERPWIDTEIVWNPAEDDWPLNSILHDG